MAKIAVIGICGKSVFMSVDHFHSDGETLIADGIYEEMGGKGFNQSIAAARMGAEVSFLAAVGDDLAADECENILHNNKIKPCLMRKKGKNTPVAFILTDKNGENRVTEFKDSELAVEDILCFEQEITDSEVLLIQNEVPVEVNEKAIEIATKNNVKIIYNPAPARKMNEKVASKIFLATPNEQESEYCDLNKFENYIITLGKKGCLINGKTNIPAIETKAVDTTGAGDTFNGVLAACITEHMTLEESSRYATVASGISVSKKYVIDAIPERSEVEKIINN